MAKSSASCSLQWCKKGWPGPTWQVQTGQSSTGSGVMHPLDTHLQGANRRRSVRTLFARPGILVGVLLFDVVCEGVCELCSHPRQDAIERPLACLPAVGLRGGLRERAGGRNFQESHLRKGKKSIKKCPHCDYVTTTGVRSQIESSHDFGKSGILFKCRHSAVFSSIKSWPAIEARPS